MLSMHSLVIAKKRFTQQYRENEMEAKILDEINRELNDESRKFY